MATGRLSATAISTTADTTVYTCPASTFSVVSVNVVNRGGASVLLRIAVASAATPTAAEYIEYDSSLVANGTIERTGLVLKTGELIVVQTPTATPALSVVVYGIETSTA